MTKFIFSVSISVYWSMKNLTLCSTVFFFFQEWNCSLEKGGSRFFEVFQDRARKTETNWGLESSGKNNSITSFVKIRVKEKSRDWDPTVRCIAYEILPELYTWQDRCWLSLLTFRTIATPDESTIVVYALENKVCTPKQRTIQLFPPQTRANIFFSHEIILHSQRATQRPSCTCARHISLPLYAKLRNLVLTGLAVWVHKKYKSSLCRCFSKENSKKQNKYIDFSGQFIF